MRKVLVADDDPAIRELIKKFFEKRDIEMITARDGEEALDSIREEAPDLVLLDLAMRGMPGDEVLSTLREEKNEVKVLIITGVQDEERAQKLEGFGIIGYIHKPVVFSELENVVLKALRG